MGAGGCTAAGELPERVFLVFVVAAAELAKNLLAMELTLVEALVGTAASVGEAVGLGAAASMDDLMLATLLANVALEEPV